MCPGHFKKHIYVFFKLNKIISYLPVGFLEFVSEFFSPGGDRFNSQIVNTITRI